METTILAISFKFLHWLALILLPLLPPLPHLPLFSQGYKTGYPGSNFQLPFLLIPLIQTFLPLIQHSWAIGFHCNQYLSILTISISPYNFIKIVFSFWALNGTVHITWKPAMKIDISLMILSLKITNNNPVRTIKRKLKRIFLILFFLDRFFSV